MLKIKTNKLLLLVAVLLGLSGCSRLDGFLDTKDRVNYENNRTVKVLDFPPDLTAPEFDKEFELPTGVSNTVSMKTGGVISSTEVSATRQGSAVNSTVDVGSSSRTVRRGDLSGLKTQNGKTVLQVYDTYPRSLILMDIMLERIGFSVQSRNQATGVYLAKYNGANGDSSAAGVSGWFNRAKKAVGLSKSDSGSLIKGNVYQIHIKNQKGYPLVSIKTKSGKALSASANTKVLTMLNNAFNR